MTYVVSNLHGNYTKFKALLKTINFKDTDVMYVLGDIVDYGEESMELVGDLSVISLGLILTVPLIRVMS